MPILKGHHFIKKNNIDVIQEKNLEKELKKILARVARVKISDIEDNIDIREDLGIDSLNAMEILAAIEIKYNITIDEAKAFDIITFKDLYELVENYLRNKD